MILHQGQVYQENIQHELEVLEEHERRLFSECQLIAQEYSPEKFDIELEYHKNLNANYEHFQQQLARCSSTLEQKLKSQEQLQYSIEQMHEDIEQIQRQIHNEKKVRQRERERVMSFNSYLYALIGNRSI